MANRIHIVQKEAKGFLSNWCAQNDWRFSRAVVFLDPYGMSVDWTTLESIAQTRAIDLWLLFPLGQAVNRLLTRDGPPDQDMAARLTRIFGTDEWKEAFYRSVKQQTLFGPIETVVKMADFKAIGDFFVARLKKIFAGVASNPLPLYNSKNVPIYLLCFAAANPRGAPTAIKIAQHLLETKSWQRKRKIEWTEITWNPVTRCTKLSRGCMNCYAERLAKRLKAMGMPRYRNGFELTLHKGLAGAPLKWKKPSMIFVNSMSDLFHEQVPLSFIQGVFETIERCPHHTFQILTKRSSRLLELSSKIQMAQRFSGD